MIVRLEVLSVHERGSSPYLQCVALTQVDTVGMVRIMMKREMKETNNTQYLVSVQETDEPYRAYPES